MGDQSQLTPKQIRNGITMDDTTNTQAVEAAPSADPVDIAALIGQAQAVEGHMMAQGAAMFNSDAGAGIHNVSPDGNPYDWSSGLAVTEVGEATTMGAPNTPPDTDLRA